MGSAEATAYTLGQEVAGSSSVGAGLGGVASAAGSAARSRMTAALALGEAAESGRQAAFNALTHRTAGAGADREACSSSMPGWARALKAQPTTRHPGQAPMHALPQGDRGCHGANSAITARADGHALQTYEKDLVGK